MAEFNPIRDLMPMDSSRESVDRSSEQIKVIETKLKETKNGVSNLLNIIKTKNSLLDKDLGKIKSLNLRLKRTIPRIPILPGAAGTQFAQLKEAQRKSEQRGGGGGLPFRSLATLALLGSTLFKKPETKTEITYKRKGVKKTFQRLNTAANIGVGIGAGLGIKQAGTGLFRSIKKKIVTGDGKVNLMTLIKRILGGKEGRKIIKEYPKSKPIKKGQNFFEKMFFQKKEPSNFNMKVNPTRVDLSKTREQLRIENSRRALNEAQTVIPIRKPRVNRENFFNRGTVKNAPFTGPQDLFKRTKDELKGLLEQENKLLKVYQTLLKNQDFKSIQKFLKKQVPKDKYDNLIRGGRKIKKRNMINSPDKNTTENINNMKLFENLGGTPKDLSSLQSSPNNMDLASLNTDTGITNTVIILTGTVT